MSASIISGNALKKPATKAIIKTADHPTNEIIALSTLTQSITDGAQVIRSPGFWDPTDSITTGTGGDGVAIRSQQTANGGIQVSLTASKTFGVVFDDIYPDDNDLGKQWIPNPPMFRWRKTIADTVTWDSWNYAVKVNTSAAGSMLIHDMDGTSTYIIEIETNHFVTHPGQSIQSEYQRESDQVGAASEVGGFYQISGFVVNTGHTFNTISWTTSQLKALVIGDSNSSGVVDAGATSTTVTIGSLMVDERGATHTWWRQIFDSYCALYNKRLQLSNVSLSGVPIATMSDATRALYIASIFDGVPSNVVDRFDKVLGWTTGTTAPFTVATRVYDGDSYTPDIVLIPLISNDRVLAAAFLAAGLSTADFMGATFTADIVTFINAIKTKWASAKIIFVNTHIPDSGGVTSHADAATALGAANLDYETDALLEYIDLAALGSSIVDSSLHLDADEHTAVAGALQTQFNTIINDHLQSIIPLTHTGVIQGVA